MGQCIECETNKKLILNTKQKAIEKAIKKGKELGVEYMVVGTFIDTAGRERYTCRTKERAAELARAEIIPIPV